MRRTEIHTKSLVFVLATMSALLVSAASLPGPTATTIPPVSFVPDPQKQVLVLMYHQVTNNPSGLSAGAGHYGAAVSPKQFDADLTYMESRGFSAVDPEAALRYLSGQTSASTLPEHPYTLTFDDGFVSAWTEATSILRRHRAKAMMFVEGIRVDRTPGRLTSAQIAAMARSGLWEIESHGYMGHWALQIGPKPSDLSPYWYANLGWLNKEHRLETPAEFEARVQSDLRRSKEQLSHISGIPVNVFAYPSGEFGQNIVLPPGANPATLSVNQGHSNASGLTPLLDQALRAAGFAQAFAVDLPGSEVAASAADAPYHFPRIAGTLEALSPDIAALANGTLRMPEISPSYRWLDCAGLTTSGTDMWITSTAQPYIVHFDGSTGRLQRFVSIPELSAGRQNQPTLAVSLFQQADARFVVYEQRGWWDGGQPRFISFRLNASGATDVKVTSLPDEASWFVGLTRINQGIVGMTETGVVYEVVSVDGNVRVSQLFALPNDSPDWKSDGVGRFAGLAFAHGLLYLVDRKTRELLGVDPATGAIRESSPVSTGVDVRSVGGDDNYLWLTDYSHDRQMLIRMRASEARPQ